MPALPHDIILHIRAFGRDVRVTAFFTSDDDANAYMGLNPDQSAISGTAGIIFIANVNDLGVDLPSAAISP